MLGVVWTLDSNRATASRVVAGNNAVAALHALMKTVVDAETGKRGFGLTAEERFLEPYHNALATFDSTARELRRLVADDPRQVERIGRMEQLFREWQRDAAEPGIAARRLCPLKYAPTAMQVLPLALEVKANFDRPASESLARVREPLTVLLSLPLPPESTLVWKRVDQLLQDAEAACGAAVPPRLPPTCLRAADALIAEASEGAELARAAESRIGDLRAADHGKSLIDAIRREAEAFNQEERAQLDQLVAENSAAVRRRGMIVLSGLLIAMLSTFFVGLWLALRIARTAQGLAKTAQSLAEGELTQRTAVKSSDELGALARAINGMADQLTSRERASRLLAQLAEMLQACLSVEEAYNVIIRMAQESFPEAAGELLLVNASQNTLAPAIQWGQAAHAASARWSREDCWALRRGKPHASHGDASVLPCPHFGSQTPVASLCVPLHAHGEALGVLSLRHDGNIAEPKASLHEGARARLAQGAAEHIGLALANLRLRDALRQQATRDPLTGLYNRRYTEESLERELARAARTGQPLTVMMADVDHFKRFNDTFGHEAGDIVLRAMGELLRREARASDIVCRFGGEEFLFILPDATAENAQKRAEQLRQACSKLQLSHAGRPLGPVTLSVGVAGLSEEAPDATRLIARADDALYQAKRAGRDRICVAA